MEHCKIPDAANCSVSSNFTILSNELLRSPELSGKAIKILGILLSNKDGWVSYITTLDKMMKEGETAIRSGIKELEKYGLLKRIKYRDKSTKKWVGMFWAYTDTPHKFNLMRFQKLLDKYGYEINHEEKNENVESHMENPHMENPHMENPHVGNQALRILSNNTNMNNKKSIFNNILNSGSDDDSTGKPVIAGKPVVGKEDSCIDSKRPGSSNDDPCGSTNHNQSVSESEHFLTSKKVGTLTLKRTKFSHDDDNATTSRKRDGVVTMSMKDKVVSSAKKDRKRVFDPDPDIVAIINYWNTLPNAVKHKGDYSSKTFKSIYGMLYNLLNGHPLQNKKNGQPTKVLLEFFQRNNINHDLLAKRWSKDEICQVLKRISEEVPDEKLSLNAVLWNRFGTNGAFSKFLIIADRGSVGKVFVDMASKLAGVLCPTISSTKREFWGKSFEELSKSYSVEEINRVLDWYVNNRDYKYVKKVKNAYEFCEYFDKIKKAMEVKLKEEQPPQEDSSSMRGCVSKLLIAHGKTADFADMFYDKIFSRASLLLTKGSQLELCRKLVDLYNYIDDQQRSIKNYSAKNVIPGAFQALVRYIDWLTENKWVTDISPKVFDPESKLFYKFRVDDAETHLGYDLLTGEMYV
jgi:hypothetical protein